MLQYVAADLFHGILHQISKHLDFTLLAKTECSANSLCLDCWVPLRLDDVNVIGFCKVEAIIKLNG